jgi:hypothetical protein
MQGSARAWMTPVRIVLGVPALDAAGYQLCLKLNLALTAAGAPGLWIRTVIE